LNFYAISYIYSCRDLGTCIAGQAIVRILPIAFASALLLFCGLAAADPAPRDVTPAHAGPEQPPIILHAGKGKVQATVIFMHGLGGSPEGYEPLLEEVLSPPSTPGAAPSAGAIKVVAIWMRPENGPHTMTDQLARARRAIDAEPGPVFLMGHSFGGKAALKLAAEYPEEKVRGVIALAPSVNMLQSYWKGLTGERTLPAPAVLDQGLANAEEQAARDLHALPADAHPGDLDEARSRLAYVRLMRDLTHHDEPGTESHVSRDTLVFHGTEDHAVSIHYARRLAATNPKSVQLVELQGVGHGFHGSPTQAMNVRIRDFIAQRSHVEPRAQPKLTAVPAPAHTPAATTPPATLLPHR
jgi:pimeloyl-ACP methyl ester carboxylesterase